MQAWRTKSGALAIFLWTMILLSGAFGCGITREVSLPNGYICYVDDFIWIAHPDQLGSTVDDVEILDVQGDIVFGRTQDWVSDEFTGYFILDTQLQVVWLTDDYTAWCAQLAELGIDQRNLRWPGVNFSGFSFWNLAVPIIIVLVLTMILIWLIRLSAEHERAIRQDRLDRL